MSLRRKSFVASAVTASLVTSLLTAPFSTAQVAAGENRTVETPLNCRTFNKEGQPQTRGHVHPNSVTVNYPSEVAPGETFNLEYQPGEGSISTQNAPSGNWRGKNGMWVGRMKYDITLPDNADIGEASVDWPTSQKLKGWKSSSVWHAYEANLVFADRINPETDAEAADGSVLRLWGKDWNNSSKYTPHNSGGDDANVGIGVGLGDGNQENSSGAYRLPKVTVAVTAQNAGDTIEFKQRGAGTENPPLNSNTFKADTNTTFGFTEYYSEVVNLCRPTDDKAIATIKVVEPYSPEFTIEVTGDEAAGSERTVTATIPNKEVTGEVKFVATPKDGGESIDLGTGEIKDGTATATKKIDNPGDYEVTATLTSPRKVYEDSTANADLKMTGIASEVQLVENQSLTVDVPGELKVTVAKGAQGKVTISKDGAVLGSTDTINADGSATVKNVTLNVFGAQEVDVVFESSNAGFESSQSKGSVQVNDKNESSLTLTPSNANPKVNEAVTLTAKVEETDADGAVQFKDGDDVLGTVNLNDNNEATYSYTPTEEGKKTLTALFVPAENSTYKGNQTTAELNVQPAAEHTGITLEAPAKAKSTEEVTLTATVEPNNVAGTVEFFNGANSLGAGEYDPATGVATLKKQLPAGTHNVTATFTPADQTAYNGQTSEPQTIEVSNVATQVEYNGDLEGKPNQAITLSAKVEADGQPVDGGTVQFNVGALNPVTAEVKNGVAEVEHTFASAGTRNVTAQYVPAQNSGYTGNTARASVAIKDEASVQLTASKTDPIVGEEVTLTAKVTPAQASGKVQLKDGDKVIEEKDLTGSDNQATFTFSPENSESKTFIAVYVPGDSSNYIAGDTGSVTITPKDAEQTTLTVAANKPSGTTEDEITLTATVPAGAQGKVQFSNNGQPLGDEQTVSNGTATLTTALPEGDNTITAQFTSDNTNAFTNATVAEADAATVTITKAPTAPAVTVTAPTGEKTTADEVTLTATVDPASEGTVEFFNGETSLGTAEVTNGTATLTTKLDAGEYTVTAKFTPAADNTTALEATSEAADKFTVTTPAPQATAPAVTVTAPTEDKTTEDEVTLTAKIDPASAGTVEFFNGDESLGTADVNNGTATLTKKLDEGDYTVTAKFTPASDNTTTLEATSEAADKFTVTTPAPQATAPAVTVTAPTEDKTTEDEVTLTANVEPASAGTVEFFNGDESLGTADVNNGTATLTKKLDEGDYTVTAKFTPASDNTTTLEATSEAAQVFTVKVPAQPTTEESTAAEPTLTSKETTSAEESSTEENTTEESTPTSEESTTQAEPTPTGEETTPEESTTQAEPTPTSEETTPEESTTEQSTSAEPTPTSEETTSEESTTQQPPAQEKTAPAVTVNAPAGKTTADDITLTATVDPASAGTVEFFNGDTSLGTAKVTNGTATFTTKLAEGTNKIVAKFTPADGNTTAKEATSQITEVNVTKKTDTPAPTSDYTPEVKQETRKTTEGATLPAPGDVLANTQDLPAGAVLVWTKLPTQADPYGEITISSPNGATTTATVAFKVVEKTTETDNSSQSSEGSSLSRPAIIGISITAAVALLGLLGFGLANNKQFKDFLYNQFGIRL